MMQPDNFRITALISVGKHPDSGRDRRAEQDARAVEMALRLAPQQLEVLHAGDVETPALRAYAGMGVKSLRVLSVGESADAVPTLVDYLQRKPPDIILTGKRAEQGESSGMLPFLLAEQLGIPLVMGIAEIVRVEGGEAQVLQALPRGQRRALRVPLPFIASVDMAASVPRQSAFGPGSRAIFACETAQVIAEDETRAAWQVTAARKRPKRMKVVKAKTAADRFKAATAKAQSEGGKVMRDEPVEKMAQAIYDLLLEEGVLR
ncbi:electron transfer flavoprotein subunit beta [Pantoea sp. A4]|uniref:electron transfer flavoprotein subunit beta n=1 Tax=Pantoea sp. A4 TaxID=1225184 RepID=UPI0003745845|nr:hypothetical protein [Pantoea sp. A4]